MKKINLNENKWYFVRVKYTSDIHQKIYAAFGIEVRVAKDRSHGMVRINNLNLLGIQCQCLTKHSLCHN
jgi:hypothetical protein